tara:strand:- start:8 stop:688 length:681 start_codon:yes stop_codon:yes gene_type:complete
MDWGKFYGGWRTNDSKALEPRPAVLPADDDHDEPPFDRQIMFEGQSFMIEYLDTKNNESRRSISVQAVKYNSHGEPCLWAFCRHRHAMRTFRIDRIQCCIDYDGEVHETGPFLQEVLELDISVKAPPVNIDAARLRAARDKARPHAILLAGLSRCDGYMHPDELGVLCQHCEQLSETLSLEECDSLGKSYRSLRPTPDQMNEALESLRSGPTEGLDVNSHKVVHRD